MDNNISKNSATQLSDIAKALGISKTTVSRAISGKGRVSQQTKDRVFACIKEMHYSPNMIAKSFSESKTYNIGVVIPMDDMETEAPFFQTCLMGITKCCAVRNYDTLVISTEKNDISQLKRVLDSRKTDGIVITRPLRDGSMEGMLYERSVPYVVIGQSSLDTAVTVDSAHKDGCFELTSYLLMNNKPENIGLILGSMEQTVNKSRYDGFSRAFENIGAPIPSRTVFTDISSDIMLRRAVNELSGQGCGCIICGDDMICIKLMNMLISEGTGIPADVKLASFYNSLYLDMCSPPVTSLKYNAAELGMTSASILLDTIEGKKTEKATMLGFEMLIRRSTM